MNYPSIRIEGAIFSPDILDRLEDAPGLGNKISTSSTRRPPRAEIFSHPWTAKKALQKRGLQQNIYEGPDEGQRAGQKNKPLKIKGLFMQMAEKVRFELTVLAYTRVPGVHLKPLGHLSMKSWVKRHGKKRRVQARRRGALSSPEATFLQEKISAGS